MRNQEIISESKHVIEGNPDSKEKDNDVYLIILNPNEEKLDFKSMKFVAGISPSIVFIKSIYKGNGAQLEEIIFKFKRQKKKKKIKKIKEKEKKNIQ